MEPHANLLFNTTTMAIPIYFSSLNIKHLKAHRPRNTKTQSSLVHTPVIHCHTGLSSGPLLANPLTSLCPCILLPLLQ